MPYPKELQLRFRDPEQEFVRECIELLKKYRFTRLHNAIYVRRHVVCRFERDINCMMRINDTDTTGEPVTLHGAWLTIHTKTDMQSLGTTADVAKHLKKLRRKKLI